MAYPQCPLCLEDKHPIRNSHVIPNAVFRKIKDKKTGKMVQVDLNEMKSDRKFQKSFDSPMLCSMCELHLSRYYEKPALDNLRGALNHYKEGYPIELRPKDPTRMATFLISVLWRGVNSNEALYGSLKLTPAVMESFRKAILRKPPRTPTQIEFKRKEKPNEVKDVWIPYYRITPLVVTDPNHIFYGINSVRRMLIKPFVRNYREDLYGFVFVFEGYRFEIQFDLKNHGLRKGVGFLHPEVTHYQLLPMDIRADETLRKALEKAEDVAHKEGSSP